MPWVASVQVFVGPPTFEYFASLKCTFQVYRAQLSLHLEAECAQALAKSVVRFSGHF